MRTAARLLFLLALGAADSSAADAQQTGVRIVVQSNANFRRGPSTSQPIIRLLPAGDTATLLTAHTKNDYLRVLVGRDTGWVYSPLVELVPVVRTILPTPPPPTGVTTAPATYHDCALTGDPSPNGPDYQNLLVLNRQKNRYTAPLDGDIDSTVTLSALLAPGDDRTRFDANRAAVIEGMVLDVKVGGVETVNCHAADPAYRDTHIELGPVAGVPEIQRVIVEVTPRWRAAMHDAAVDWSTAALQTLIGKRIRVRGWLLFDAEHVRDSEHTNPGNASNWRATAWEVHPVTSITVLP